MLRFVLLFLAILPSGWASVSTTDALKKLDRAAYFEDGILASIWGSVETRKMSAFEMPDVDLEKVNVPNPFFRNKVFKVALARKSRVRAPLVVVLAGLFSDSTGALPLRYLRDLTKRGYHVAIVANSWSTEYLEQGPQFKPAEFRFEAQAALHTILQVKNLVGAQYVDGVSLLGESYGAFLTSVVLAMDQENLVNRGGLLLGPPVDMSLSMRRLDELIASARGKSYCRSLWTGAVFLTDIALRGADAGATARTKDCGKYIFSIEGFQKPLAKSISRMDWQMFHSLSPDELSNLSFSGVVRRFLFPEEYMRPPRNHFDLGYWLRRARQRDTGIPLRIITAKDDILNVPEQWNRNAFFDFNEANLTVLGWGGHVGFVMAREFRLVLDGLFGPTQGEAPPPLPF